MEAHQIYMIVTNSPIESFILWSIGFQRFLIHSQSTLLNSCKILFRQDSFLRSSPSFRCFFKILFFTKEKKSSIGANSGQYGGIKIWVILWLIKWVFTTIDLWMEQLSKIIPILSTSTLFILFKYAINRSVYSINFCPVKVPSTTSV